MVAYSPVHMEEESRAGRHEKGGIFTFSRLHSHGQSQQGSRRDWLRGLFYGKAGVPFHGWKPRSLSPPILLCMIFGSLCIIGGLEMLAERSAANGGLFLSESLDDLPAYATFSYLYAPNIIAATYSLLWNWIDLDVKRMQPWFELSKPEGATGGCSLLLEYPSDFLPFVPLKALKRRHWHTFVSGTTILVIFWAITPLSGAVLGTGPVSHVESISVVNRSNLLPLGQQALHLDTHILNEGYAIGWLGQSPPPFTSNTYALLPFYTTRSSLAAGKPQNITGETWKLTTDLVCHPAKNISKQPSGALVIDNGAGCRPPIYPYGAGHHFMYYIGYESDAQSDWALELEGCPRSPENERLSLAIWAFLDANYMSKDGVNFPITALYCRASYYKQRVIATVNSETFLPYDDLLQPVSEAEALSDAEFDGKTFEHVIINGMGNRTAYDNQDIALNTIMEQQSRLEPLQLSEPGTVLTAYAVAGQNLSVDAYADPETLSAAFRRAHQYLFSVAVSGLMEVGSSPGNTTATTSYVLFGVIVSSHLSTAVESLMGVVVILLCVILWLCWSSPSHVVSNPNSITRFTEICGDSVDVRNSFADFDSANQKVIQARFQDVRFRLVMRATTHGYRPTVERMSELPPVGCDSDDADSRLRDYHLEVIRPFFLRVSFGVAFVAVLLGAIATIVALKVQEQKLNGLPRPSTNFEVMQLLENYLPTVFATLIEPLWVLLNRLLCVLQPFKDLTFGHAAPHKSIEATYTAIPPQLVMWRAIKARHFTLVLVCVTALVANLLGIGVAALFNEDQTDVQYPSTFHPILSPEFTQQSIEKFANISHGGSRGPYQDPIFYAIANESQGTRLPPWVSQDYFFIPHTLADTATVNVLQVPGFGAAWNCTTQSALTLPSTPPLEIPSRETVEDLCGDPIDVLTTAVLEDKNTTQVQAPGSWAKTVAFDMCNDTYVLAWARMEDASSGSNDSRVVQSSFAACHWSLDTGVFNVTTDTSGYIVSYNRVGSLQHAPGGSNSSQLANALMAQFNTIIQGGPVTWHNSSTATDWLGYLVVLREGTRAFLDPKQPPPDPVALSGKMGDAYRMLFALALGLEQKSIFLPVSPDATPVDGIRVVTETRIFLDRSALFITLAVLACDALVAMWLYCRLSSIPIPRMPNNLGSLFAYLAASQAASNTPNYTEPLESNRTYSFGRFLGMDGKTHIGIEADPHVVTLQETPLSCSSLKKGLFQPESRLREGPDTLESNHI